MEGKIWFVLPQMSLGTFSGNAGNDIRIINTISTLLYYKSIYYTK